MGGFTDSDELENFEWVEDGLADIQANHIVKWFAIVKLWENDGGSNSVGCFEIKIWADATKLAYWERGKLGKVNVDLYSASLGAEQNIWSEEVTCLSEMKPRLKDYCVK